MQKHPLILGFFAFIDEVHLYPYSQFSSLHYPTLFSSAFEFPRTEIEMEQHPIEKDGTDSTSSTYQTNDRALNLTDYHSDQENSAKEDGAEVPHQDPNPFHSPAREVLFVGIVCMAQLSTQISLGQTLNLVHIIGHHFNVSNPGTLSWFVAGYSLTVGSFILLFGRFGDYYGYKRLFIIGLCWFSFWSMVVGVSNYSNFVLFIFARVFQGEWCLALFHLFRLLPFHTRNWSSNVPPQCRCHSWDHLPPRSAKEHYIRCVWCCCSWRCGDWGCFRRHLSK